MNELKELVKVLGENTTVKIYGNKNNGFKKKVYELRNCDEDYMYYNIIDLYTNTRKELVVLLDD